MRMKLAMLSNTKPDCLFENLQLAQVAEEGFEKSKGVQIRQLSKTDVFVSIIAYCFAYISCVWTRFAFLLSTTVFSEIIWSFYCS